MARHFKLQKQIVHKKRKSAAKTKNFEKEVVSLRGRVKDIGPNMKIIVQILDEEYKSNLLNGQVDKTNDKLPDIETRIAGKMRKNNISLVRGDYVQINVSCYDPYKGTVTFRYGSREKALKDIAEKA